MTYVPTPYRIECNSGKDGRKDTCCAIVYRGSGNDPLVYFYACSGLDNSKEAEKWIKRKLEEEKAEYDKDIETRLSGMLAAIVGNLGIQLVFASSVRDLAEIIRCRMVCILNGDLE